MIGVVLDTNVLVSATLKERGSEAQVVALALNRKIRLFVSDPVLEEYERVLRYPRLKFAPQEVTAFLALVRSTCVQVRPRISLKISPHETDNHFYEGAAAAKASFLVTGNKKQFPVDYKTTKIVSSRELLELLALTRSLDS